MANNQLGEVSLTRSPAQAMPAIFIDQEFRSLIFPLSPSEYAGLKQSLILEGNRVPIDTWKGYIVDGHNRYDICHKHSIPLKPPQELKHLKTRTDVLIWIIRNQLDRRNLNNYQRSILSLRLESKITEKAKEKQLSGLKQYKDTVPQISAERCEVRDELAKQAKVSHDTIWKVKQIEKKAPEPIKAKLQTGEVSINEVYKQIKKEEEYQVHLKALEELRLKATSYSNNHKCQLYDGDFVSICLDKTRIEPESIDAIITDPPWTKETMHTFTQLAEIAYKILKPNGIVLAMVGQAFMPEAINRMAEHLKYWWIIAYMLPGVHTRAWAFKIAFQWKPVLLFVKDSYKGDWIFDVVFSKQREKRFHAWQSSDSGMKALVENTTKPNDLILDPFMGSGATGIAALRLNRRFIGIDLSKDSVEIAKARLMQEYDR